jgi:hypothetical protein
MKPAVPVTRKRIADILLGPEDAITARRSQLQADQKRRG